MKNRSSAKSPPAPAAPSAKKGAFAAFTAALNRGKQKLRPAGGDASASVEVSLERARKPVEIIKELIHFVFAFFLACVVSFHGFFVMAEPALGVVFLGIAALTPAFYFLLGLLAIKIPDIGPSSILAKREKLSATVFITAACITFAVLLLALGAYYPGGASFDNHRQWAQVQTGVFDDWHPAIHTMIIWLITRVVNRYAFFIAVQMFGFSLLVGYMAATLRAWGLKTLWVVLFVLTILTARSTRGIMLFAWKDTMFSLLALALAAQMINIVLSKGAWLDTWGGRIGFAVALALTSLVRHNGMFFTIPLVLLLFILYGKRRSWECTISTLMALLLVFLVRGPLYRIAHVTRDPDQGYVESIGFPMTILCSVYRTQPERLDEETTAFLASIATEEQWETHFSFGSYNTIKWAVDTNLSVADLPLTQLLRMTWRTVWAAPTTSLRAALDLTQFVWDPNVYEYSVDWGRAGDHTGTGELSIEAEAERADQDRIERLAERYRTYTDIVQALTPSKRLQSIGACMIALILAGGYSLRRRRDAAALLLITPSILYNLGTMLMLCGSDYRFFQFNVVITVPLVFVCLAKEEAG